MNTIIKMRCIDQVLTFENTPLIASGGQGEDAIQVSFCSKWDGMTKTAVFWRTEEEVYHVLLDDKTGEGVIPWEVLVDDGVLYFGVLGVGADGRRRTSGVCRYLVKKGALIEGKLPADPTPSMYEQILAREAQLQESVDGVVDAANAAATAAKEAEDAAKAAAVKAESAAEDAAAAAVELVQEEVAEAVEMARTSSAAAEEAAQSAQQAVKKAEAAAEEAATSAKKEVLEMGAVLYSFGSYEGTGAERVITLPVTPKLVHIWGAAEEKEKYAQGVYYPYYSASSPALTLGQGETFVTNTTDKSGKAAVMWVRLEGNTLVFDWMPTAGSLEGNTGNVTHLNESGAKYSIVIVYAPGDEVDNTVQLTVVNEFGELAEGKEFYVKVGEMTYEVDTVLRLEKGTEVNCFVQDTVDGCSLYYNGHWKSQTPEYKHYIRLSVSDGVQLCYTTNTFGDFSGVLAGKRSTGSDDTLPQSLDSHNAYVLRMLKDDNILYLKIWKAAEDEPTAWNLTYVDDLIGAPVGDESDAAYNWKLRLQYCDKGDLLESARVSGLRLNGGENILLTESMMRSVFETSESGISYYNSGVDFSGYGSHITTRERMSGNYELWLKFQLLSSSISEVGSLERDEGLQITPFKDTTNPKVTGGQWNYTRLLDKDTKIILHDDGFGGSRVDIDDV